MNTILGFGVEDTGWRRHQKNCWNGGRADAMVLRIETGGTKNIRISVGETAARIYK